MMQQTLFMIGFAIYTSLVISGCTTPLITLEVEEAAMPPSPHYSTRQPLTCTVYTDSGQLQEPSVKTTITDDDYPKLPPIADEHQDDYEHITNHLLDYIEELQEYIEENS